MTKTYKTRLVHQTKIILKDGSIFVYRYDRKKNLLYKQNRSHDMNVSEDEYMTALNGLIEDVKKEGHKIKIECVAIGSKWPQH